MLQSANGGRAADTPPVELAFGWVPAEAVRGLLESVDLRARSAAMDVLRGAVLDVGAGVEPARVRASLSAFLAFLLRLVADPSFKVAAAAMAALQDLAAKLGADLQPYLGSLTPPLIERMGDGEQQVRDAAALSAAALARSLGPAPVLAALGGALVHPQWRVREAGAQAYTAALLAHPKGRFDYPATVWALAAAAADEHPCVAAAALEAFAVLHSSLGPLLQGLLTAAAAPEEVKRRVAERVGAAPLLGLPTLDAQGLVQHPACVGPTGMQLKAQASAPPAAATLALHPPCSLQLHGVAAGGGASSPATAATPGFLYTSSSSNPLFAGAHDAAPETWAAEADVRGAANVAVLARGEGSPAGTPPQPVGAASQQHRVERSDGSLLSWARPACKPRQQSFAAPHASSKPAAEAALEGAVREAERSVVRPIKPSPAGSTLRQHGEPATSVFQTAVALAGRDAAAAPSLPSGVRSLTRQLGSGGPVAELAEASSAASPSAQPSGGCSSWRQPGEVSDEASHAVRDHSDSLLHWRLPQRSAFSRQAGAPSAAGQPPAGAAASAAGQAPQPMQQRPGSASLRRTLGSFKKRLLGLHSADSQAAIQPGWGSPAEQTLPGSPPWSIAAARDAEVAGQPTVDQQREQEGQERQEAFASPPAEAAEPGLRQLHRTGERLSRLKRLSERRRASTAPLEPLTPPSSHPGGFANQPLESGQAPGSPAVVAGAVASASGGEGSPGERRGLQALKARARTACALSSGRGCAESPAPAADVSSSACSEGMEGGAGHGGPAPWLPERWSPRMASYRPSSGSLGSPPKPQAALLEALGQLQRAAASHRRELDWQAQHEALRTLRRLARHHAEALRPCLKTLLGLAAPVIDALRSTLSRLAIAVFQELAEGLGPLLDPELELFVPLLLKRSGQASLAGRDNFLAAEADAALAAVVRHCGEARVAAALLACLAASKSADVRAKAALHLDSCVQQHGARLLCSPPDRGVALLPRLLRAAVGLLEEGRLEARTAGKRVLWELRRQLDSGRGPGADDLRRALARLDCDTDKVLEACQAPSLPALPAARARLATPGPGLGLHPHSPASPASSSPARPGTLQPSRPPSGVGSVAVPAGGAEAGTRGPSGAAAVQPGTAWQLGGRPASTGSAGGVGSSGKGGPAKHKGPSRPPSGRSQVSADAAAPGGTGAALGGLLPSGTLAGLDLELQQVLEAAEEQLRSGEWRERLQGLQALASAQPLPPAPGAGLWLAAALVPRAVDANLRVQQRALAALSQLLASGGQELSPACPALVPALCKCLDSGNPPVRQEAVAALEGVMASWDPAGFLPPLMAALGLPAGGARGKALLLERLNPLLPSLWQRHPAPVRRHVVPALLALVAGGRRPELRQLAHGSLSALARLMGAELAAAAAGLPVPQQAAAAQAVAAARSG